MNTSLEMIKVHARCVQMFLFFFILSWHLQDQVFRMTITFFAHIQYVINNNS